MFVVGVFAVLVLLQFAALMVQLKDSSETSRKNEKPMEAPMKVRAVTCSVYQTAWTLGGNVAVGLFLS